MRLTPLPLLALGVLTVGGCTFHLGGPDDSRISTHTSAEPFSWSGRLEPGAVFEVRGVNGPIRAEPATGDRVELRALRSARRDDPAEVEIRVVEHARGVTVCTVMPADRERMRGCDRTGSVGWRGRSSDARVEYTVAVPAGVRLTARTVNGAVTSTEVDAEVRAYTTNGGVRVTGARSAHARSTNGSIRVSAWGPLSASTTNGSIAAALLGGAPDDAMELRTTNGSIELAMPESVGAHIEASAGNGRVATDMPILVQGSVSRRRLSGTIGQGGPEIRLRTTNGSITLKRAPETAAPRFEL